MMNYDTLSSSLFTLFNSKNTQYISVCALSENKALLVYSDSSNKLSFQAATCIGNKVLVASGVYNNGIYQGYVHLLY